MAGSPGAASSPDGPCGTNLLQFLAAQLPLTHSLPASVSFLNAPEAHLDSAFVSHHLLPGWAPCAQAGPFQNTLQGPQGNPLESSTVINPLCVEPPEPSTLEGS